ncbi:MAG: Stf0 family sulfotransferase [Alphaproteobacteria bacterium]
MAKFQSYIICTSPRSGSTLLCGLLAATGTSGNPASYFHTPSIADWLARFDLSACSYATDRAALRAIFDAARVCGTAGTGMFGLRLQRHSFAFFMQQLDVLYPGRATDQARIRAAFGDTLFIYLTRHNKLDQAISLAMAQQTGLWHRAPDGTELERLAQPRDPVYARDEIAGHMAELTALDEAWQAWFAREKIEPVRITYHALSAEPTGVLADILQRLELDPSVAHRIAAPTARLADRTNRDWAERFMAGA